VPADENATDDQGRSLPRTDQPLHGPERRTLGPVLIVIGILVVVAIIFVLISSI
jgi:hypothetical protein